MPLVPKTAVKADFITDQIVIALTREQSEMVRSLLYARLCIEDGEAQREFLEVLAAQFEQCEDEQ